MADVLFLTMKDSPWEHYYDNIIPHLSISYKHVYYWNYDAIMSNNPSVIVSIHSFSSDISSVIPTLKDAGIATLIPRLKKAGIATLLLQEGATEWMMNWENPRLVKQIPPRHRPVLYDKIGVYGPLYRRIEESWGNLGKCEMVGSPRWDNLKVPKREPREGRKFRLMLASARVVGYDESTINKVVQGFKDLSDYLQTREDIEVYWRVGELVEQALNITNNNAQLEGLTVGEALSKVDAVICTPSSFLIEAMITNCPVASLDYIISPRYFNPAWTIHCADDIEPVINELMDPPASKMMFQQFICDDVIYKPGSAGKRAAKLIHELANWAKKGHTPEDLPSAILEETTWPVYLPPKGLSLSTLFPEHPMFVEQSEYEMRAELAALRQEHDECASDRDKYKKKLAELQQASVANRLRQLVKKIIPERIIKRLLNLLTKIMQAKRYLSSSDMRKNVLHWFRMQIPLGPKILLLNYSAGEPNWGCKATSKGLLKLLRKAYPYARLQTRPVFYNYGSQKYHNRVPSDPDGFDSYLTPRIHTDPEFMCFDWADVIILNGEGTIHEWADMRKRPEPYLRLLQVYAAKRFFTGKKVMAVNQTIHYWSDEFAEWVKVAYKNCDYLSVREPRSLARLKSLGLQHTQLVPDAAFLTQSVSKRKAKDFLLKRGVRNGYIGLFFGENVGRADFNKIEDCFIRLQKFKKQIVLFAAPWPDVDVVQTLKNKYNTKVIGLEAYPEMLVGILALASLVLSGRFHCCILSALAGTPFVPFRSNTDKIEGTIELLEYSVPVTVFEDTSNDQIMELVEEVWENHVQLKKDLQNKVPEVVRAAFSGYNNVLKD